MMNQKKITILVLIMVAVAFVSAGIYIRKDTRVEKSRIPAIERITPAQGPIGEEISVIGSGFTPERNSLQFGAGFAYINNLASLDGKTLLFALPESFDTCNPDGSVCAELLSQPVPGQTYQVFLINANGRSNPALFTVAFANGILR